MVACVKLLSARADCALLESNAAVPFSRYRPLKGEAMNKGGFSWKRAVGITNAKRRVARATGIPWTKSGRQRKVGPMFWKLFKYS
jgi:hypothetical protein